MGLFGLLKYAYSRRLVKHDAIATPPGIYTPIAIDLWNVMYTLMEKFCIENDTQTDSPTVTAECFFSLLKLLQKRSYFPIFVSDRGINGDGHVKRGAKAIATQTMCHQGGSGRLGEITNSEGNVCGEILKTYKKLEKCEPINILSARWSSLVNTPKLCYKLCVNLIRHLGFPYVNVSDMEADDVCANLYHTNTAAQIYTTDTDLILMGCDIILDVVPLFPPTLRCRDILASLNVSYPEFLCTFVRCHTDLHQAPILKSVQSIIKNKYKNSKKDYNSDSGDSSEESGEIQHHEKYLDQISNSWRISDSVSTNIVSSSEESSNITSSESSDTDSFGIPKNQNGFKILSKINSPSNKGQSKRVTAVDENSLNLKYTSRFPPIMKTISRSLMMLPAPQTKHEVLERKFIKHLTNMITPEYRGENLSILKRVPIIQEKFDINLVYETLLSFIDDKEKAKNLTNLFWKHISIPIDYNLVLISYWDDSKSRRWV
ncbi:tegument host shutoff protein [Canid alphaherpesvirus 1]|nr:tegument host shutoff protein [Canid alphaherpesvirus 1]QQL08442.1 tegument host shutoff protein [Canid alphaherpesvirus 1]WHU31590.1 tegument host shutoff protein [Canid alphaherpesvirus 1]WHU31664.1 tegument host shutoff protein [Canid alphaherpesvirus 1]